MMNFSDFAFLLVPQGKRFSTHANVRHSAISDGNPVAHAVMLRTHTI